MDTIFGRKPVVFRECLHDKGSLDLRSNHMNYSRAILNSKWTDARECEPKDYDLSKGPRRNIFFSTYTELPPALKQRLPMKTTYEVGSEQPYLLGDDYRVRPYRQPIISEENFKLSDLYNRCTGKPLSGHSAILPHHPPGHGHMSYMASYIDHYRPSSPIETEKEVEDCDYSPAYRRVLSQFTDCFNLRRAGRNHWLDESGLYYNRQCRLACPFYSPKPPPFKIDY